MENNQILKYKAIIDYDMQVDVDKNTLDHVLHYTYYVGGHKFLENYLNACVKIAYRTRQQKGKLPLTVDQLRSMIVIQEYGLHDVLLKSYTYKGLL